MSPESISIEVPPYNSAIGVVAPCEGGEITVAIDGNAIYIKGNPAGLRDLARWCLALSDPDAPLGAHVHLDPGVVPLTQESEALLLAAIHRDG